MNAFLRPTLILLVCAGLAFSTGCAPADLARSLTGVTAAPVPGLPLTPTTPFVPTPGAPVAQVPPGPGIVPVPPVNGGPPVSGTLTDAQKAQILQTVAPKYQSDTAIPGNDRQRQNNEVIEVKAKAYSAPMIRGGSCAFIATACWVPPTPGAARRNVSITYYLDQNMQILQDTPTNAPDYSNLVVLTPGAGGAAVNYTNADRSQ